MSSKKIYDLYLPKRVAWHVKIFIGSVVVALLFNVFQNGQIFGRSFIYIFTAIFIQVEIAMYLANKFFTVSSEPMSTREYQRTTVRKLLQLYAIAMIFAVFIFLAFVFMEINIQEVTMDNIMNYIVGPGLKSFLVSAGVGLLMGSLFFFYMQWLDSLKREQKLKEEKLIFQYETLKNQVNPHFLFNSLNTLSSLVYKDPKQSDQFIKKLSIIYRYILENNDREAVDLQSEINFVKDFFYLQKIRDNGKIALEIEIEDIENYQILPISLQLLVENAIKHNSSTRDKKLTINIRREDENIVVSNDLQPKMNIEHSSKIGLKNLSERITLMTNKKVEIIQSENQYIVKVPLIRK